MFKLLPEEYVHSAALKDWVRANKHNKFVPEGLLQAWGFDDSREAGYFAASHSDFGRPMWKTDKSDVSPNTPARQRSLEMPASTALKHLCEAIKTTVEDLNARFHAGLEVRQTETTLEVYDLEKPSALLRVDLKDPNDIQYSHFIRRHNEMLSGTMHVSAVGEEESSILFPDLPRSPLPMSYEEASKRLLGPTF